MKKINLSKMVILFFALVSFVSCGGQKPMITDIQVKPYYQNSDVYVSLVSNLSLGNVTLPGISLPIIMPNSAESIGSVEMMSVPGGQNIISLDVNLSKIASVSAQQARLPNGNLLPLIGLNEVIVIPIQKGVNLYLAIGNSVAALGVNIPFSTLDSVGSNVGNSSLFPTFHINNILGSAGLYFSKQPGQNGFGLFADISSVLDQAMFIDLGSAKAMSSDVSTKSLSSSDLRLDYSSMSPGYSAKKKIDKGLYRLHRKGSRLQLK